MSGGLFGRGKAPERNCMKRAAWPNRDRNLWEASLAPADPFAAKEAGEARVILFNLCGHGHFDMSAYSNFAAGKLVDVPYDEAELAMALSGLPAVPA